MEMTVYGQTLYSVAETDVMVSHYAESVEAYLVFLYYALKHFYKVFFVFIFCKDMVAPVAFFILP